MIHGNAVEIVGLAGKGGQIQIPILADHHGREHIVAAVVAQELLFQIAFIAAQKRRTILEYKTGWYSFK